MSPTLALTGWRGVFAFYEGRIGPAFLTETGPNQWRKTYDETDI